MIDTSKTGSDTLVTAPNGVPPSPPNEPVERPIPVGDPEIVGRPTLSGKPRTAPAPVKI